MVKKLVLKTLVPKKMLKFFVIAWFSVVLPNQSIEVGYLVNTSLQFNSQYNCHVFLGFEGMPLSIGVEDHLNILYPNAQHTIESIGCIDSNKLKELDKTQNSQ